MEAAWSGKFDLALLDLKMLGMDGKQALEILKKEHKYLEVAILTGHGSVDSAIECSSARHPPMADRSARHLSYHEGVDEDRLCQKSNQVLPEL